MVLPASGLHQNNTNHQAGCATTNRTSCVTSAARLLWATTRTLQHFATNMKQRYLLRERESELYQRRQKRCFFNWQVVKDLKPPPCAARGRRKVAFKSCFPVRIIIFLCDSFFVELSWGHVALGKYTYSEIISKEGGRVLNMDRAPWSYKVKP